MLQTGGVTGAPTRPRQAVTALSADQATHLHSPARRGISTSFPPLQDILTGASAMAALVLWGGWARLRRFCETTATKLRKRSLFDVAGSANRSHFASIISPFTLLGIAVLNALSHVIIEVAPLHQNNRYFISKR